MEPELSIDLKYLPNRTEPTEVFDAMSGYIKAYRALGQLMLDAVGQDERFEFQLSQIQSGSIISKLKAIPGRIDEAFKTHCFEAGNATLENLTNEEEIETEDQVDSMARLLEGRLSEGLDNPELISPYIDRKRFAEFLAMVSTANRNLKPDEKVYLNSDSETGQQREINTSFRFTGDLQNMFKGTEKSVEYELTLFAKTSVNEGNSVWNFRCEKMKQTFQARIEDKPWLEKYQNAVIAPIGPKDTMIARVAYDIFIPANNNKESVIRNARVIEVIDINRGSSYQDEIKSL
ncbi:hypothetical protein [Pseudoalteromonas rubra]|uniref:hypothetical protein n=1 Tax=Pseudoalteromonas rubra TaxID=43658 RepID=UPI000F77C07A|nr:hypothetical protein [Pseudoalteromonas rubra]